MATIPSDDLCVEVFVYIHAMPSQAGNGASFWVRDCVAWHASAKAVGERSAKWSIMVANKWDRWHHAK